MRLRSPSKSSSARSPSSRCDLLGVFSSSSASSSSLPSSSSSSPLTWMTILRTMLRAPAPAPGSALLTTCPACSSSSCSCSAASASAAMTAAAMRAARGAMSASWMRSCSPRPPARTGVVRASVYRARWSAGMSNMSAARWFATSCTAAITGDAMSPLQVRWKWTGSAMTHSLMMSSLSLSGIRAAATLIIAVTVRSISGETRTSSKTIILMSDPLYFCRSMAGDFPEVHHRADESNSDEQASRLGVWSRSSLTSELQCTMLGGSCAIRRSYETPMQSRDYSSACTDSSASVCIDSP